MNKKITGFLFIFLGLTSIGVFADVDAEKLSGVPNAVVLEEGLVAGGVPTDEGLKQVSEQGIQTIIDVRNPEEGTAEEQQKAEALGLKYVNIPVSAANFSETQAQKLNEVLKDPATGSALLHCATGQRAVSVWALQRNRHEGVSAEQALAEAREKGLKKPELEAKLQGLLQ